MHQSTSTLGTLRDRPSCDVPPVFAAHAFGMSRRASTRRVLQAGTVPRFGASVLGALMRSLLSQASRQRRCQPNAVHGFAISRAVPCRQRRTDPACQKAAACCAPAKADDRDNGALADSHFVVMSVHKISEIDRPRVCSACPTSPCR